MHCAGNTITPLFWSLVLQRPSCELLVYPNPKRVQCPSVELDTEIESRRQKIHRRLSKCSYTLLKNQLIMRLSVSETIKVDHLLTDLALGDRTPSQLLWKIKRVQTR